LIPSLEFISQGIGGEEISARRFLCRHYLCEDHFLTATGYRLQLSGARESLIEAIRIYQDLLGRDSDKARRWADLGEGLLAAGDTERARYCYSRALALGRSYTEILLNVADFHFEVGENVEALGLLAKVLAASEEYDSTVFASYKAFDVGEILEYGLPKSQRAAQAYFRHLLSFERIPDSVKAWKWLVSNSLSTDRLAGEYSAFLVRHGHPGLAAAPHSPRNNRPGCRYCVRWSAPR